MKVKNISGSTGYFRFGVRGVEIKNNETYTIITHNIHGRDEVDKIFEDVLSYADAGLLEILEGPASVKYSGKKTLNAYGSLYFNDRAAPADTIQIGDSTYEFTSGDPVGEGNIAVDISSTTSLAEDIAALKAVINDNPNSEVTATSIIDDNTLVVVAKEAGSAGNTIALVASSADVSESAATLGGGFFGSVSLRPIITHEVTAEEVTRTRVLIETGLASISDVVVQARTSAGALKYFDGAVTTSGGVIKITIGSDTKLEADDVLTILISA